MNERIYLAKRILKAKIQSLLFYICRVFPIKRNKIVFCCIEGTTGYTCNPKYIAEELMRQNVEVEMVWLVNDISKVFPDEIHVVKNTLWKRAYHLSTARIWIDNSRKQLEVRKRKGQIYYQTWHGKIGFKSIGLNRGKSFSKIAYLVSKHDSDMIDYVITNSRWFEDDLEKGMLYEGPAMRIGSPRCDILLNDREMNRKQARSQLKLPENAKLIMHAPTFRGGSQGTKRELQGSTNSIHYEELVDALEERFGGEWYVLVRQHPQVVARNLDKSVSSKRVIDVSRIDDMYEILAGCDAFVSDYSSAAFDAAVMNIPVFVFAYDYNEYVVERGELMWDLNQLPFPYGKNEQELFEKIKVFDEKKYQRELTQLFIDTELLEDGKAGKRMVEEIRKHI